MKTKIFDCVELKRRAAEKIHEELMGLNQEQRLKYWKNQTDKLKFRLEKLKLPKHR